MGGFASIARSLGDFGSQVGQAKEISLDWRQKQQQMALAAARQKLEEQMLPLQIQEIQARLKEQTAPKPYGVIGTRGGGQAFGVFNPATSKLELQQLESGADPEKVKSQIVELAKGAPKEFQPSILSHVAAIDDGADPMKELTEAQKILSTAAVKELPTGGTVNRLQQRRVEQITSGDFGGAAETLQEIQDLSKAAHPQSPTQWNLITRAQQGDKDAAASLKMYYEQQEALVKARGLAFGQGRLYTLQAMIDEQGQPVLMTGFDVLKAQTEGRHLTPGGRIPAQTVIAYQQLQSEAQPALAGVQKDLGAFDNANDRAIFARVMERAGQPVYGNEASWLGNVLDQAAQGGLSPQGQDLVINMRRLGETMGRVRSLLGLQASDSAMALTMGLLPSGATPNSQFAAKQLNNLNQIINQAMAIPMFGGMGGVDPNKPRTPPPGSKVISLNDFLKGQTQ